MSKRAQERMTQERPAVAKPRSACLVSRNLLSARQNSSLDSCASHVLENQVGPELRFRDHKVMCARQSPKLSNEFSRVVQR